jgi:hypothetical protein
MNPVHFPGAAIQMTAPEGLDEKHVKPICACVREMVGGVFDGSQVVTVAWKPDAVDLEVLNAGGVIYFNCVSALPIHWVEAKPEGTPP